MRCTACSRDLPPAGGLVLPAAAALLGCLLLLASVAPGQLARSSWPSRAPSYALLLWQALGLSAGLLAVLVTLTVGLAPAGATHAAAARALLGGDANLPWWSLLALGVGIAMLGRLLSVLLVSTGRTLHARHRNRVIVDLVATRNPLLAGTHVVDHDVPTAYCLPGLRPRVVVSRGVLDLLREDEVRAVLAHENAHVEQRHDLVVLPFVALRATLPRSAGVRTAQEQVALLVEMLADDRAARSHPPAVLARALCKVGATHAPLAGPSHPPGDSPPGQPADGTGTLRRANRLVSPGPPLPRAGRLAVLGAAALVLALPGLGLLVPAALA